MNRLLLLLLFSLFLYQTRAQQLYLEDFDQLPWSTIQSSNLPNVPLFQPDSILKKGSTGNSANCFTDSVAPTGTVVSYMTTPVISIRDSSGIYRNLNLEFDQICHLAWLEKGTVEISVDNGIWYPLPDTILLNNQLIQVYQGLRVYSPWNDNRYYFNSLSDTSDDWRWRDTLYFFSPNTNAWKHEIFSIDPYLEKYASDQNLVLDSINHLQFRFGLYDDTLHPGRMGNQQWWIDNVELKANGITTGINDQTTATDIELRIYPNPASNAIQLSGTDFKTAIYSIYNLAGKTIQEGKIEQQGFITIESFPNGLYFLQIELDKGSKILKLIKN
jgi:hypothetical protein